MSDDIQQDQIDRFGVVDDPLSILRRLENANLSLSEMLVETLHAVRTHLGMDVAFISEFRGESRIFRYLDGNFVPLQLEVGAGDPLDESYCQRVLDGRLPELIQDAASLPEAQAMPATKPEKQPSTKKAKKSLVRMVQAFRGGGGDAENRYG